MDLKDHIRGIPDFPKPGIYFYDISTLLRNPDAWQVAMGRMAKAVRLYQPDLLAGVESRGFLIAAPLALKLGCGFIMMRKRGKLPGETIGHDYRLEYGTDRIEVQADAVEPGQRVVVVDDLLATGGTMSAGIALLRKMGAVVPAAAALIELTFLNGRRGLMCHAKRWSHTTGRRARPIGMTETNLIVGAGQAAGWAAMAMRDAGFTGRIIMLGGRAWQPYERPPLSKAMLTAHDEPTVTYFHPGARYAERNVSLRLGETAEAIEPSASRVLLRTGDHIAYDRLLIATGGRARALPIPGGEHAVVLRTLEDARALRQQLRHARHVVCIGAGVIGLEIAASARALGCDVTVLEAAPRSLGRAMSPEAAAFVERLHRSAGTAIHTGVRIEAIETAGRRLCRAVRRHGPVHASLVIAGIGMKRNDELAARAGIEDRQRHPGGRTGAHRRAQHLRRGRCDRLPPSLLRPPAAPGSLAARAEPGHRRGQDDGWRGNRL